MPNRQPDLIAVLLVTDSSKGSNLVFRWPPKPHVSTRLSRPRPPSYMDNYMLTDASFGAALTYDSEQLKKVVEECGYSENPANSLDTKYRWKPPGTGEKDYVSSALEPLSEHSNSVPEEEPGGKKTAEQLYEDLIGYEAKLLAELLSPKSALCHQKFELIVDELVFVGHPVHAKDDGSWNFSEVYDRPPGAEAETDSRGRTQDRPPAPRARFHFADDPDDGDVEDLPAGPSWGVGRPASRTPYARGGSPAPVTPSPFRLATKTSSLNAPSLLKSFHLVLVLDRPDPSSVASTDLDKYIDAYYRQFAFKLTAAMLYEQGRVGFVAQESDLLVVLRDKIILPDSPNPEKQFQNFFEEAFRTSSLANAIRSAYEAVISASIAQVLVNTIPVNVQLPPGHLDLLKVDRQDITEDVLSMPEWDYGEEDDEDVEARMEDELRFGWKIPPLRPWKSVLVFDDANPADIVPTSRRTDGGDRSVDPTEALTRFLSIASPTLSLSEMSDLLDLDLETEIYSLVRLLVYNRKAKVVDVVRANLTNIYAPPPIFSRPLSELSVLFTQEFPTLTPLPSLLSAVSLSHRPFGQLVPSRDHRAVFLRALIWMLAHDLLVMLHLRVRIVVSREIKVAAIKVQRAEKEHRAQAKSRKLSKRRKESLSIPAPVAGEELGSSFSDHVQWADVVASRPSSSKSKSQSHSRDSHYPRSASRTRQETRIRRPPSGTFDHIIENELGEEDGEPLEEQEEHEDENTDGQHPNRATADSTEVETSELEEEEDHDLSPSFLIDPERATRAQRRWLDVMCVDKEDYHVRRFRKVSPFFDGKKTTDEMLYRTDISRRELREVLEHFGEHLMLLLHP